MTRAVEITVTHGDEEPRSMVLSAPCDEDYNAIHYWMHRMFGPDWDLIQHQRVLWQQHNASHGYDLNDDSHDCGGECNDYGCP